jgi:hypothetical protein
MMISFPTPLISEIPLTQGYFIRQPFRKPMTSDW